jgi:predicted Zn-dependent peptidase
MYQVTRLANGLTVATAAMPHMASVSLGLWVGVGGRYEPAELNGAAHFIEHMLFKGTRRRSARAISEAVEGIGGYLNAFTGEDSTCFYAKALHDRFDDLLDVLLDMFLNSTFDRRELEKERGVIKEEVAMYLDQPAQHVHELLNETLWPDHPLGRPLTGTGKSIDAIQREPLLRFMRANYVTGSTLICAAGNVAHAKVVRSVRRYARCFPAGGPPSCLPAHQLQTRPWLRLFTKDTAQAQLALAIRTCSRRDRRRYALRVLNAMVAESMSSRLFQLLREDRGLVYHVSSSLSLLEEVGVLVISAGLDTEELPQVIKLMLGELSRFAQRAPGAKELQGARDYLAGQLELSLENTESHMNWLGEQLLAYGRVVDATEAKRRLSAVTAADLRRVAADFFRPENLCLAVISPLKRESRLKACLRL